MISPEPPAAARSRGEARRRRSARRGSSRSSPATGAPARRSARRWRARRASGCRPASAASAACWMTGPSITGSEYGRPTSTQVDAAVDHRADRRDRPSTRRDTRPAGSRPARPGPRHARRHVRERHCVTRSSRPSRALRSDRSARRTEVQSTAVSTSLSPRPDRLTSDRPSGPSSRARRSQRAGERVRALDRRDDALGPAQQREGVHRLGVGDRLGSSPGRSRAARRARARRPGSPGPAEIECDSMVCPSSSCSR